jgi:transcriptional regulator with XRE-family HTH domain
MKRLSSEEHNGALRELGAAIRVARKERAVSQEALADLAGLDRSHMGKIERGERNVSILNVIRISAALNMSPSELLRRAHL